MPCAACDQPHSNAATGSCAGVLSPTWCSSTAGHVEPPWSVGAPSKGAVGSGDGVCGGDTCVTAGVVVVVVDVVVGGVTVASMG